jgi:hypothetical protein
VLWYRLGRLLFGCGTLHFALQIMTHKKTDIKIVLSDQLGRLSGQSDHIGKID